MSLSRGTPLTPPGLSSETVSESVGENTPREGEVPNPLPNQKLSAFLFPETTPVERWLLENAGANPLPFLGKIPSPERCLPDCESPEKMGESVGDKTLSEGSCGGGPERAVGYPQNGRD